ncbi:MAG: hypothetical protein ACTSQJ_18050 [Promethearchaeota archaeon]
MIFENYFDKVSEGIEFLVALGSIIGLLGLICGLIGFFIMGNYYKGKFMVIIVISFILIAICGLHTGTKYFRI